MKIYDFDVPPPRPYDTDTYLHSQPAEYRAIWEMLATVGYTQGGYYTRVMKALMELEARQEEDLLSRRKTGP